MKGLVLSLLAALFLGMLTMMMCGVRHAEQMTTAWDSYPGEYVGCGTATRGALPDDPVSVADPDWNDAKYSGIQFVLGTRALTRIARDDLLAIREAGEWFAVEVNPDCVVPRRISGGGGGIIK